MDAFHNVFHVSQLKKCLTDQDIVLPEIPADLGKNLTLETRPVRIIDRTEKAMRKKTVPMIKVVWDHNGKDIIDSSYQRLQITWIRGRIHCWWGRLVMSPILDRIVRTGHGARRRTSQV